uniref:Uncharacterized protein n=1 Tax=Canis lupus familiaris TaxID=9615 RepID=A0A8C0P2J3_CANLF
QGHGVRVPGRAAHHLRSQDHLVPERELGQIQKHIYRVERARGLRDHKYRLLPQRIPSETKTHKTKNRKHRVASAKEQIKGHQNRMIRGRELMEQRSERLHSCRLSTSAPPLHRPATHKDEEKEYELVTAYPIAQPYQEALIEVTILMEKSRKGDYIKKPLQRELLSIPPFLRSQLGKNKV